MSEVGLGIEDTLREWMTPKNWKDACGGGVLKEEKDWFGYKTKGLSYAKARRLDGILLGREIRPTESGIEQVVWDEKDAQLSASILPSIDTSFLYAYLPEWTAAQLWGHLVATFERTDMETQRSLEGELMRIEYEGDAAELQRQFESVQANLARFAPSKTTARNAYLAALNVRVRGEYLRAIAVQFPGVYGYHKEAAQPLTVIMSRVRSEEQAMRERGETRSSPSAYVARAGARTGTGPSAYETRAGAGTGDRVCYKCGQAGHLMRDCPVSVPAVHCNICGQAGHYAIGCVQNRGRGRGGNLGGRRGGNWYRGRSGYNYGGGRGRGSGNVNANVTTTSDGSNIMGDEYFGDGSKDDFMIVGDPRLGDLSPPNVGKGGTGM